MNKKSNDSKQYILEKSKKVFVRKGFANVTMKDIVEECNISRGGLYHHFSSVNEIFEAIVKHEKIINSSKSENNMLDSFFDNIRTKLTNTDISLLRARIEYELSHGEL